MKCKFLITGYLLTLILIFSGCAKQQINQQSTPQSQPQHSSTVSEAMPKQDEVFKKDYLKERESLMQPYSHNQDCHCSISTEKIMEGTDYETTITTISSSVDGKNIFVVGGVHGDEIAGYMAADLIEENFCPKKGNVYVISPANQNGAKNNSRYVGLAGDLNRAFPGNIDGEPEDILAYYILESISLKAPDILIDMHEAYIKKQSRDFLGSSIIFTATTGIEDFLMEFIIDSSEGIVCTEPFNFYNGAPKGSINQVVTNSLNIPAITIETFREYPIDRRIYDHLDIFLYACKYNNIV